MRRNLLGKVKREGFYFFTTPKETKFAVVTTVTKSNGLPLYLVIDEYDNFTNTLIRTAGNDLYVSITHGSGFYREWFKLFKVSFAWGLYDTPGNVPEWQLNWWYNKGVLPSDRRASCWGKDPEGLQFVTLPDDEDQSGPYRAIRGGAYNKDL